MKEFLALISIALVLAFGGQPIEARAQATKPDAIRWQTSLDSALRLAAQQGKPVFLEFYNPK
jgi:hypothetical protein